MYSISDLENLVKNGNLSIIENTRRKKAPNNIMILLNVLLVTVSVVSFAQTDFPDLKGPYFGQKPPGKEAKIFGDGIICTLENPEMCAAVTADGREFYFNRLHEGNWVIFETREKDGKWTVPRPMPFTSTYTDRDFTMSPDGREIYFGSNRPMRPGRGAAATLDIWKTMRDRSGGWQAPVRLASPVNTPDFSENYPSAAGNGNLYFFSCRDEGLGGCEIYICRRDQDRYLNPENLGPAVNSVHDDWDAYISPDETYIIFSSLGRPDSVGDQDLYISFRKNGIWTTAVNMGSAVNSVSSEICPWVSLDGRYLFFTSRRRGKADIYWVDAGIIRAFKTEP